MPVVAKCDAALLNCEPAIGAEIDPRLQSRVICVTGDVITPINKAFLSEASIPCVFKPFGVDDLMEKVKQILEEDRHAQVTHPHR